MQWLINIWKFFRTEFYFRQQRRLKKKQNNQEDPYIYR